MGGHQHLCVLSINGVQAFPNCLGLHFENTINYPGFLIAKKSISNALKRLDFRFRLEKRLARTVFLPLVKFCEFSLRLSIPDGCVRFSSGV
jgi:hypothetical protein